MKKIAILLLMIVPVFGMSQETEKAKEISNQFKDLFNKQDYQNIFNLFEDNMKAALPLEETKGVVEGLFAQVGAMETLAFKKNVNSAFFYLANFEKAKLNMVMALDSDHKINGLNFTPFVPENLPKLERNITKMKLPFNEEWDVFWGGETVEQNYHVAYNNQKYAYDLLMLKDGKSHSGDSKNNENYYVFGKEIIAPCDATVMVVIDGVIDNVPGELNPKQLTGNTVVLKTDKEEFILFAHLKQNSVVVKEGQTVKQGDLLGLCGNSGNTTEAHLHLSLQNVQDMDIATGAKLYFDNIKVNGALKEDYLPVKNDKIKN